MPTFYNVIFNQVDFDFEKSHISMKFFDYSNACAYAENISECADIEEGRVDIVDGTTGEVVATYILGMKTYENW